MNEPVQTILAQLRPVLADARTAMADAFGTPGFARAARNYNRIERAVFALEDVLRAGPDGRTA